MWYKSSVENTTGNLLTSTIYLVYVNKKLEFEDEFRYNKKWTGNGYDANGNVIYKIKNTMSVKQSIKAILMTIVLISLILFVVLVPAFGEVIINAISKDTPGKVIDTIHLIYDILKYPISFILIFLDLKILYTMAPNAKIPSVYNNYGTLFTTVMWIIITKVYSIYLNHFNTYDIFYGSFGNVVIMLFWIYLLAYVFTMGMAINAEYYFNSQISVKEKENTDSKN